MVVSLARRINPSPLQPLLLRQQRQQAKHNRAPRVQLHPHQPVRNSVGNVLEMRRGTLDQRADGNDRVERLLASLLALLLLLVLLLFLWRRWGNLEVLDTGIVQIDEPDIALVV